MKVRMGTNGLIDMEISKKSKKNIRALLFGSSFWCPFSSHIDLVFAFLEDFGFWSLGHHSFSIEKKIHIHSD